MYGYDPSVKLLPETFLCSCFSLRIMCLLQLELIFQFFMFVNLITMAHFYFLVENQLVPCAVALFTVENVFLERENL